MSVNGGHMESSMETAQRMIEVPGDQIDEIVRQAKQEAVARAKTIIENAITQSILERALVEMQSKSTAGIDEASDGSPALSAEEACRVDEQIREEIRRIKEEIAANEARLSKMAMPPPEETNTQPDPAAQAQITQGDNAEISLGHYVYAIIGNDFELPAGKGIDPDRPIHCVSYQDIRAVVSNVSLSEFSEEAFSNKEWLMVKVQAHQGILDELSAARTAIPMRFCTIYSSEHLVHEMLEEHHDDFASALARLEGKREWGVKAYCASHILSDRVAQISDVVKSLNSEIAEKSEAAAYFTKKRIEDAILSEKERITNEVVQESHNSLWMRSWEAVVNPLQDRDVTQREDDMVLNGAYLVSQDCVEAFQTELDELRKKYAEFGFSYELSGPWPPYNFAGTAPKEDSADEPVCA